VTIRRQKPYGALRGGTPAWPNQKGFVGGDNDSTGLTHLGARDYDPVLGRFISVDPDFNKDDPQSWSGYTYADNSPITCSDPTGLRIWEEDPPPQRAKSADLSAGKYHPNPHPNRGRTKFRVPYFADPYEQYTKAEPDAKNLPKRIVAMGIAYARKFGVDEKLAVALLMQEQPFYSGMPYLVRMTAQSVWAYADGHTPHDFSLGPVQMHLDTARQTLITAGYGTYQHRSNVDLRNDMLSEDFAVSVAVLKLKEYKVIQQFNNKQSYLAYCLSDTEATRLARPGDHMVQNSEILSERSIRYDANMTYLESSGKSMTELFGIKESDLSAPRGFEGGFTSLGYRY
jgi:RHS repeat-associated protein